MQSRKNGIDDLIWRTAIETQIWRTNVWKPREQKGVGSIILELTHTHTHTYLWVCSAASVMFDSLWPYVLKPTRLLCPWDSPVKNPGVDCHASSRGSLRPRNWTWATGEIYIPWRRKWIPTLVFLPGESHRQRRLLGSRGLVDYSLWGCKKSDITDHLSLLWYYA